MSAAGEFLGALLATAGFGYLWLGLTWGIRAYKHWPRASCWSALAVIALLGISTATATGELVVYGAATLLAGAFMVWRERRILFPKAGTPAA